MPRRVLARLSILLLAAPGILVACGQGGSSAEDDQAALAGAWRSGCYAARGNDEIIDHYMRDTVVFRGSTMIVTYEFYAAADRSCGSLLRRERTTAGFEVGETAEGVAGARELDVTPRTYEATPVASEVVTAFRSTSYCGIVDWAANVPRDISGGDCLSEGAFETYHDIYRLRGDTLHFGYAPGGAAGATPAERPRTLDESRAFTRAPG